MEASSKRPFQRQRTPYNIVLYAIYLYSSGLSLRQVAKELEKRGVKRSYEAIRQWVIRLGGKTRERTAREKQGKNASPSKPEAKTRVHRLPRVRPAEKIVEDAEKLYERVEKRPKPQLLILKKPLRARQALSLLSPKYLTSLFPANWCAFVKGKLEFNEAVEAACMEAVSYYIEETARVERERTWRPRKARWGLKRRSFLARFAPHPSLKDLWPLAVKAASAASRVCRWNRRGRVHDSRRLLAALLLKYVPSPKSYRQLAEALRREKLSTGLGGEAYPSKSTLFDVARSVPLGVLLTAITILYLQLLALYARKFGRAVVDYAFYTVDSTCIGFDSFSGSGRLLLRFAVLYWPVGGAVACVFGGAKCLAELVGLVPRWGVLIGDGEFWCRRLLLACLGRGVRVAIKRRGRAPLGLRVDMGCYWVRKVCEQVFARVAKCRRVFPAKTGSGAVVLLLLFLAGCNLATLWRRARLLEMFACI